MLCTTCTTSTAGGEPEGGGEVEECVVDWQKEKKKTNLNFLGEKKSKSNDRC
jgi:hypothetical protein